MRKGKKMLKRISIIIICSIMAFTNTFSIAADDFNSDMVEIEYNINQNIEKKECSEETASKMEAEYTTEETIESELKDAVPEINGENEEEKGISHGENSLSDDSSNETSISVNSVSNNENDFEKEEGENYKGESYPKKEEAEDGSSLNDTEINLDNDISTPDEDIIGASVWYGSYNGINYKNLTNNTKRIAALDKARDMVTVQWSCPQTFRTWYAFSSGGGYNSVTATDGSTSQYFVAGKTYQGIPYTMVTSSGGGSNIKDDRAWASSLDTGSLSITYSGQSVPRYGIDCSGFIYRALQNTGESISHLGTSQMGTSPYYSSISWDKIQPGDILLKSGHVVMFVGMDGSKYAIFEATPAKTRYYTYTYSYLSNQGYKPYTFNGYGEPINDNWEVDSRYSAYLPAKAYAVSTGKVTVYDQNLNAYSTSSRWIDGANDLCIIHKVYTNGYCLVEYPTSNNQTRTERARTSDFIPDCSPSGYTANKAYDAYRRPSGSEKIGDVYAGDSCLMLSASNGRTQVIYPASGTHKIGWIAKEADTPTGNEMGSGYDAVLPDGDYQIVSAADASYYLDVEGTALPASGGTNVSLCGPAAGYLPAYEVWNLKYSGGFYTIRQRGTDMCLDVANADRKTGANLQMCQSNGSSAQKWAISRFGDGKGYRLQAKCSGYSMDINGGSIVSGTNVQQWVGNDGNAQRWLFIPYEPARTVADGRYVLVSALDPRLVLDISGDTGDVPNGTNVQVWNDGAPSRYNSIDVKYLEHGYYRLTHAASGKSLDVYDNRTTAGTNIQLYTAGEQNNKKWAITKNGDGYTVWSRCSGLVMDVKDGGTANGTNVWQYYYNGTKAQTWKFVRAEYSVKYDANGGSGAPGNQVKYYANALTLSSAKPTMSGRTFKGWATSKTSTTANYQPGGTYTDNKDVTLYAVWEDNSVTGVSLNASSAAMKMGETRQLTATVSPSDAKDKTVTWTSSNTSVATVSSSGLVTAVGGGSADITVRTKDGGKTAVFKVTVPTPYLDLNGYLDSASSGSLGSYGTADIYIDGKIVKNDCSDYAQQWPAGTKYEIKDIRAKAGYVYNGVQSGSLSGTVGTQKVTVVLSFSTKRVTGVAVSLATASLKSGETKQLTASVTPSDALDRSVTWSSSNTSIARVDSSGKVTAAGEGTADITVRTNDGGKTAVCRVTVSRIDLSGYTFTLSQTVYTYDGKAKEPAVTVKNGSTVLTSGTDYSVSYANNVNAGTATAKVTGKGKYKGEKSLSFTINKAEPKLAFAAGSITKKTTDAAFTNNLSKTTDGTVTFVSDKTNVATVNSTSGLVTLKKVTGTAVITAKAAEGKNYKAGSAKYTLTVTDGRIDISACTVTLSPTSYTYDGKAKTPTVTVKNGSSVLKSGADYTVTYPGNCINAGSYTIVVNGAGNYKGIKNASFTINKAVPTLKFAKERVSYPIYDPTGFTNALTKVTDGTISYKSDNSAVAAVNSTSGQVTVKGIGTAVITATAAEGKNYKAGSAKYTLSVSDDRVDIATCTITLSPASYTYTGKARKPAVAVKDGEKVLAEGTDFTVTYANNTNAGTATAKVEGKGKYKGEKTVEFTIKQAAPKLSFAETAISKTIGDDVFINELTKTTDGKITFKSVDTKVAAVNSSNGVVTIKGVGTTTITATAAAGKNYKAGTTKYTLTVVDGKKDISEATGTLSATSYTYNGKAKKPAVTVMYGDVLLKSGTDYDASYKDNVNAGTATVRIVGKENYKGELLLSYTIKKASAKIAFAEGKVSKTTLDAPFTNKLTKTTDGKVTFKSSKTGVATVNSTSGRVTIRGAGTTVITVTATSGVNYKAGKAEYTLTVIEGRIDISDCAASTKKKNYPYTGKPIESEIILELVEETLVEGIDYTLSYKNNTNIGTATVTATGTGKYTGTRSCTFQIIEIVPVYRLFNTRTGEHFYTVSTSERQRYLNAGNWNAEGIAWYAPKTSSEPIYRLSNPNNGNEHHYTKSKSEKDWLVGLGWKYDCIAWYSDIDKTVPIYRHYHPIQRTGNHHYTTSKGESDHIVKYEGWKYEGIAFYVSKAGG